MHTDSVRNEWCLTIMLDDGTRQKCSCRVSAVVRFTSRYWPRSSTRSRYTFPWSRRRCRPRNNRIPTRALRRARRVWWSWRTRASSCRPCARWTFSDTGPWTARTAWALACTRAVGFSLWTKNERVSVMDRREPRAAVMVGDGSRRGGGDERVSGGQLIHGQHLSAPHGGGGSARSPAGPKRGEFFYLLIHDVEASTAKNSDEYIKTGVQLM